jgi:hypothetical protein
VGSDLRWQVQRLGLEYGCLWSPRVKRVVQRAVISSDLSPGYLFCVPLTALFWNRRVGATVTVAAVGGPDVWDSDPLARLVLDTMAGWELNFDLRFIPAIEGLSSGNTSQAIRLWLPTQYLGEFCVLGDADLLPLQSRFFCIARCASDSVYLWNGDAYSPVECFPMCYVGASGAVWKQIFPAHDLSDALRYLADRYRQLTPGYRSTFPANSDVPGWFNDETILADLLRQWDGYPKRAVVLRSYRYCHRRRLHRSDDCFAQFDVRRADRYVDAHLPREAYRRLTLLRPLFEAYVPQDLERVAAYFEAFNRTLDERHVGATDEMEQ